MKSEETFIQEIDARLSKFEDDQVLAVIREGCQISDNAAFMVLYELSCMGVFAGFNVSKTLGFLNVWTESFEHPLNSILIPYVQAKVSGELIDAEKVMAVMLECAKYPQQINALNTAYYLSVTGRDFEAQSEVDKVYEELLANSNL